MNDSENIELDLATLVELQLLEREILKNALKISTLKKNEKLVKLMAELEQISSDYNTLAAQFEALEQERKKIEGTIKLQSEKIKKNEEKLFSGTITSSKELVNYQEEIAQFKKSNDEMESRELELMISVDETKPKLKNLEDKRNKIQEEVNEVKSQVESEIKEFEGNVENLKNLRNEVVKKIPAGVITRYNELKLRKGGIALAVMKNNICDVCNMELPIGELAKIRDEKKIHKCPTCGRMLIINTEKIEAVKENIRNLI